MSEQIYTGKDYKSNAGYWVRADDTDAKYPDKYYKEGIFEYDMFVEKLPNDKVGVWLNNQPLVTTEEVLQDYLPCYHPNNPKIPTCLYLGHQIYRGGYGAPYQEVKDMYNLPKGQYEIHHSVPVNGLLALFYADRVEMKMTLEGQFCEELRDFFELDNYWLWTKNKLFPVTKKVHKTITENQTYDFSADIDDNIKFRTNEYLTYPQNDYYQFLKGRWLVNIKKCVGTPRYSHWGGWEQKIY